MEGFTGGNLVGAVAGSTGMIVSGTDTVGSDRLSYFAGAFGRNRIDIETTLDIYWLRQGFGQ